MTMPSTFSYKTALTITIEYSSEIQDKIIAYNSPMFAIVVFFNSSLVVLQWINLS